MLGVNPRRLLAGATAILCIAGLAWLALDHFVPAPPKKITIAGESAGSIAVSAQMVSPLSP